MEEIGCHGIDNNSKNQKSRRRRKRRRGKIAESELNLINDLTHFPHLASLFQPQLRTTDQRSEESVNGSERDAGKNPGIMLPEATLRTTDEREEKIANGSERDAGNNPGIMLPEATLANLAQCLGGRNKPEREDMEEIGCHDNNNNKNRKRRRRRRRIVESDLNLLNDLTHSPHLAALFQAQLRTPHKRAKCINGSETTAEKNGGFMQPEPTKKRRRRRIAEADLQRLNDLTHFPHLAAIFQAQFILRTPHNRDININRSETIAEKTTGGITLPEEATGKELEKLKLLESMEKTCCRMIVEKEIINDSNEERTTNDRKKKRKKTLPDDELKLLNDLSGYPYVATIFEAPAVIGVRKAFKRKKMDDHVTSSCGIGSWPHDMGHSHADDQQEKSDPAEHGASRGDCIEGTYELLQMHNDEVIGCPSSSHGHVTTNFSNSENTGELICHSPILLLQADLVTQSREVKSSDDEWDASREDCVEVTYEVVQTHKHADTFEMVDHPSSSPRCVATDFSNSRNIGGCSVTEDQQEKSNPNEHELDLSREDSVEGTCEMLELCIDAYTLEETDCFSSSPGCIEAVNVISSSRNIEELISPSAEIVREDQQEKSCSSEHDRTTGDVLLASLPLEEILPMKLLVDDTGDRDACREGSRSVSTGSKSATTEENIVLRKLLRKWRYFDSGNGTFSLEGHAVKSASKNQRKRCYVCGDLQHNGKRCRKRRTCYFCNERGHLAEDCPKSSQEFNICLRCGESGHDLDSCTNGYPPDDLKNIVCYVCNKIGHLCCSSYTNINSDTVSCYNCGESGHSGMRCPKPSMDKKKTQPPSMCYNFGEEGPAARKCGLLNQKKHQQAEDRSAKSEG